MQLSTRLYRLAQGLILDGRYHDFQVGGSLVQYVAREDHVYVASLRTKNKEQRKGSARAAMTAFLALTDAARLPVRLDASPLTKAVSLGRLVRFYQSLGFELTGKRVNMAGHPSMLRMVP